MDRVNIPDSDSDLIPEAPYTSGGPAGIAEDGEAAAESDAEQREKHDEDDEAPGD